MASAAPTSEVHYPRGDGQPMAETWLRVWEYILAEDTRLQLIESRTGQPIPTRTYRADTLAAEVERLEQVLAGGNA